MYTTVYITLNNNSATFREKIPVRLNTYRSIKLAIYRYPFGELLLNSRRSAKIIMRCEKTRDGGLKLGADNGGDV